MGNYLGSPRQSEPVARGYKRTIDDVREDEDEKDKLHEQNLHTPKRKKLKSTSKYIYETLFLNGENSDVKIIALGREWRLHKIYLCQSGYFSSMFSGSWKESTQNMIRMDIPDQNIDEEALQIAFGSLYRDDVLIKPARVSSVLAAATLLGLDGLIHQCANVMRETISAKTVSSYYSASVMYGQQYVTKKCIDWLEKNLMTAQSVSLLKEISCELMQQVVSSPNLFVMQVEMDIYTMLKKWLYLELVPSWSGSYKHLASEADAYLKKATLETAGCFLESHRGSPFMQVFKGIRLQHVINDLSSAKLLEEDKILPSNWLLPVYRGQWQQMLRVEQGLDKGPEDAQMADFDQLAMRCGRVLHSEGEYCWRWTGFNFGVDLLVSFTNRLIIFKRNTFGQSCPNSVSLQSKRHLVFRVTVASFNTFGQTQYIKSTGIQKLSLGKDEEAVVMAVDRNVSFPLHISLNVLVFKPHKDKKSSTPAPTDVSASKETSSHTRRNMGPAAHVTTHEDNSSDSGDSDIEQAEAEASLDNSEQQEH